MGTPEPIEPTSPNFESGKAKREATEPEKAQEVARSRCGSLVIFDGPEKRPSESPLFDSPRTLVFEESSKLCEARSNASPPVQTGDLVILGDGVPTEYRYCPAVVTKVAESHCTVVVLDETRRSGLGECWPGFHDVALESLSCRLGTRIVVNNMHSRRTQ